MAQKNSKQVQDCFWHIILIHEWVEIHEKGGKNHVKYFLFLSLAIRVINFVFIFTMQIKKIARHLKAIRLIGGTWMDL